jgi:sec-independent protein translocase protein TatA
MGSLSIWHWLLVIGVGVLLFGGKGKVSSVMGDFAKGIKAFKSGMKEPEEEAAATNPPAQVTPPGASPAGAAASTAPMGVGGGVAGGVGDRPRDHA